MASPTSIIAASAERRAHGKRLRTTPELRRASLDSVAMKIIKHKEKGIAALTLQAVATDAQCSSGLVGRYYGGAAGLRLATVNALAAAQGDCPELRRVFVAGYDPKTKGLRLPKGFKP